MKRYVQAVMLFHGRQRLGISQAWTPKLEVLRRHLIHEELGELELGWYRDDIGEVMDAVGDLMYVIAGTAVQFGYELAELSTPAHGPDVKDEQVVRLSYSLAARMIDLRMSHVDVGLMLRATISFARVMDLPYDEIFDRVQIANMSKTPRTEGDERVSVKGTTFVPPVYDDLVKAWRARWRS